jgi:hypothetical protein
MSWISWLEARFSYLGIPRLMRMIAFLNAFVYVLTLIQHDFVGWLVLSWPEILSGQVWRLVTFTFVPRIAMGGEAPFGIAFIAIYIWYLIWIGDALEHALGAFRLTLYYVLGMLGAIVASFLFGLAAWDYANLSLSLFFAYATLFPENQIYLMLVFRVKMKWAALITLATIVVQFFWASLGSKVATILTFANYIIFFGPTLLKLSKERAENYGRRKKFESRAPSADDSMHRCAICKKTEVDNPELEFRVARDGEEYCVTHLPSLPK